MSFAPHDPGIRADALFVSALQPSDHPSARQVRLAVAGAVAAYGGLGCVSRVAQDYGEHPETAVMRMRWARTAVAGAFGTRVTGLPPRLPCRRQSGQPRARRRAAVVSPGSPAGPR